ncbi:hypothetical protein ACN38_g3814 [Penicillium nordicum]|uniref:Uncharacterized protein n=1 Tax=Penicillium nordicum TaxID=229535 RepID=A0A0M9WHN8_9EURO|nr:hypothetical protein ACN38_g3814 [Penicillium nordicum]
MIIIGHIKIYYVVYVSSQNITIISRWTAWGKLKSKVPSNPQGHSTISFLLSSLLFNFIFLSFNFILTLLEVSSACQQNTLISLIVEISPKSSHLDTSYPYPKGIRYILISLTRPTIRYPYLPDL